MAELEKCILTKEDGLEMIKKFKIWWLKRKAKSAYIGYHEVCNEYECASILTRSFSTKAINYANRFNSSMRKLKELGEKVPDIKL
jgi:hypothetical protein